MDYSADVATKEFQSTLPARGATQSTAVRCLHICDFNPRSLHGERQRMSMSKTPLLIFQSTLPARGATVLTRWKIAALSAFQSTLPARGATNLPSVRQLATQFQSTLPARGATGIIGTAYEMAEISIHAPCTGSDEKTVEYMRIRVHFNPRSLHGERRLQGQAHRGNLAISIHAPCTGSDAKPLTAEDVLADFNPRSLHGERPHSISNNSFLPYFNPRSLHGERQRAFKSVGLQTDFNPRSLHGERRLIQSSF